MHNKHEAQEGFEVSEMAIVDTFTKLIFDEESYSAREVLIVQAFRAVDHNVLRDSHAEMGAYLRNLGVSEMIQLVARVRDHMISGLQPLGSSALSSQTTPPGIGSKSLH